ncbi:MAG: 2-oxoglutarate dehydrogenase complex dihydrolipoyllysine-residue succinyltransferase [Alkalispirochaetaceae bacterium]
MKQVEVPQVGESVSSGTLAAWLKNDGEFVNAGDEIFELETDKATLPVPSPYSGKLVIKVAADEEVEIGQVVAEIDTEASPQESSGGGDTDAPESAEREEKEQDDTSAAASSPAGSATSSGELNNGVLSPAVRRMISEHGLDPASIRATGKNGLITKEDVQRAFESGEAGGAGKGATAAGDSSGDSRERGGEPSSAVKTGGGSAASSAGSRRRVAMSKLRQRIAENLVRSKQSAAHLTTFNEVDMQEVIALRGEYKGLFEESYGVKLGFMSFFLKAAQKALESYPEINAYIDGTDIVYNDFYNIGVALSSEKGLIVPVVKNVENKGFADIEKEILDFIERGQKQRIMPDEMTGGTFTISNGGVFGSMLSTPIPSPPQSGVLGMHAIQKRPVAIGDEIVIRPMMYLALTYDHRVVDGREAIGFLVKIKELIEDPRRMLLGL